MEDHNAALKAVEQHGVPGVTSSDRILARIGHLTRTLLDSMSELGLDRQIGQAAEVVPDARERLRYVATMTEQAAERVLTAIELAKPIQADLQQQALDLGSRWSAWPEAPVERPDLRRLMSDTRAFLGRIPDASTTTNQHLLEILMAQDFQDLTGQVIKKIMDIVFLIEQQLLSVLVEHITPERREQFAASAAALANLNSPESLMNGPQIAPEGKADVMQGQADVDDLLASLGF